MLATLFFNSPKLFTSAFLSAINSEVSLSYVYVVLPFSTITSIGDNPYISGIFIFTLFFFRNNCSFLSIADTVKLTRTNSPFESTERSKTRSAWYALDK